MRFSSSTSCRNFSRFCSTAINEQSSWIRSLSDLFMTKRQYHNTERVLYFRRRTVREASWLPGWTAGGEAWLLTFWANSCHGHHSTGLAFFCAIGEQQISAATGAHWRRFDALRGDARADQLAAIRFREIEKNLRREFAVAGGAGGQKQERIFFVDGIGIFDFAEQLRGVGKLGLELGANLLADFIAAAANAGADRCLYILRAGSEPALHLSYTFFDDSFHGAAPARVKHAHGAAFGVDENDGETIRGLNGEQQAGSGSDQAVAGERRVWVGCDLGRVDVMQVDVTNDVGVNLAEGDEFPALNFLAVLITLFVAGARGFESAQEGGAIAVNGDLGVVFGEAEVQISFGVGAGESAGARGEAVDQPRELFQILRAKDAEFRSPAGWFGSLGWHRSMLQEATRRGRRARFALAAQPRACPERSRTGGCPYMFCGHSLTFALGQREGYERVAEGFFGDLGMAAGCDHNILFSVCGEAVGHRRRVSAVRELRLP